LCFVIVLQRYSKDAASNKRVRPTGVMGFWPSLSGNHILYSLLLKRGKNGIIFKADIIIMWFLSGISGY